MSDADNPRNELPEIPEDLRPLTDGARWEPVMIGASGAKVYRLLHADRARRYLKIAAPPTDAEAREEAERLLWLRGKLPVPDMLAVHSDATATWLLLGEVPGVMSCDARFAGDAPTTARRLAEGLRLIHSLDITNCPFDRRLDRTLYLARARCQAGLVDESDFDDERQGRSAASLLAELEATRPATEDLVFTHGDYCLPNVLFDADGSHISAYLDWGRAGVADRYQDLAIGARSVRHNLGDEWGERFLVAYGLSPLDRARLDWYETLDELF